MRKRVTQDVKWDAAVGRNIEAARKRRGMSAKELCAALGISHARLYWYEVGHCSCPARLLFEIAAELCIEVEALAPK